MRCCKAFNKGYLFKLLFQIRFNLWLFIRGNASFATQ